MSECDWSSDVCSSDLPVKADRVEDAMDFADTVGISGLSVTVPFKEDVIQDLAQLSAVVGEIGACNTIVKRNNQWQGYNTDAEGLQKALLDFLEVKSFAHKKVAIIGAGGAARAAAYVVKQLRGKACIFNRTPIKAKAIADHYGFKWAPLNSESTDILAAYSDIIIQTTSIGNGYKKNIDAEKIAQSQKSRYFNTNLDQKTRKQNKLVDPIYFYNFRGHEKVYDVIYKPEKTPMLERAEQAGCSIQNGYSMLFNQGIKQFSIFTGVDYNEQ